MKIDNTYIVNSSKFVLFKWMSVMDSSDVDIEELSYLLHREFKINPGSQNMITTRDGLSNWLKWSKELVSQSSHLITDMDIASISETHCTIEFNLLCHGKRRSGGVIRSVSRHSWILSLRDCDIPRIETINAEIVEDYNETTEAFESTYNINKALALIYRWFSLLDRTYLDKYIEDFVSLLDEDFEMTYPASTWHKRDEVRQWLLQGGKDIRNAHHIKKIDIIDTCEGKVDLTAELKWESIDNEGRYRELAFGYDFKSIDYGGFLPLVRYFNGYEL